MPFVVADRVRETTTTTGTGTITLSGTAPTGFQTFGTAIGNGNNTFYTIAGGSEWEVGIGTYTAAGTTLSRDTVLSSSAGGTTKVTFSAGTKDVFVDYPAGKAVYQDGSITAALGTVTAPSYSFTGDTNTGMFSPAADFVALSTAGVERLRIRSNGRVGVNVDPGSQFQVRSPASDTMAEIAVLQAINVAGTDSHGLAVSADPTANIVQLASTGNNVGGFTFLTGGTERMRLDSGGNFLINATSGAGQLTVNSGSGAASILLTNTSTSNPYLQFANGSFMQGISDGSLRLRTTTAFPLIFDTNSAERMRIEGTGAVVLPKLTLSTDTPFLTGANINSGANPLAIGSTGATVTAFFTNNTERMRITSAGNVGVGTTSPASKFQVSDSGGYGIELSPLSAGFANIQAYDRTGSVFIPFSLTASYLTFQTNGTTERMRITSAGDVGIGTTGPSAKLDVVGTGIRSVLATPTSVGSPLGSQIYLGDSNFTSGFVLQGPGIGAVYSAATSVASELALYTYSGSTRGERMRITNTGDVGIGITSPGSRLDVAGALMVNGTLSVGQTNKAAFQYGSNETSIRSYGATTNSGFITFRTGGGGSDTERMRLDSAGNLGINTTSPIDRLGVNGGIRTVVGSGGTLTLHETDAVRANLMVAGADASGSYINATFVTGGSAILRFQTAGSERARIDAAGILSVGAPLAENSTGVYSLPTGELRVKDGTEDGTSQISIYNINTTNDSEQFFVAMNLSDVELGNRRGGFLGLRTSNAERMRITSAGDVGIGTTSPSSRLHVNGNFVRIDQAGSNAAYLGNAAELVTGAPAGAGLRFDGTALRISASSTEIAQFTSGGSFGIGTTSPAARLHTNGGAGGINAIFESNTSADTRIEFRNNATRAGYLYWDANEVRTLADPSRSITSYTNGVERMRINSSGNVGIGITAPAARLHVVNSSIADQLRLQDVTTDATTKYGVVGAAHYTNAQSPITIAMSASSSGANAITVGGGVSTMTSATLIQFFTAATATTLVGTERMRIDASGNVGIGTTPTGRLDVNGNIRTTVGSGGTLTLHETDATRANQLVSGADASGSYINATFATGGSAILRLQTANTERMRITAAGDVGIGTTAPAGYGKLAVIGNIASSADGATVLTMRSTGGATNLGSYNATGSTLAFQTNASGSGEVERMRITAAGDVGIGTTAPTNYTNFTTLDLNNATNGGLLNISKAGATVGYIHGSSGLLMLANATNLVLHATGANTLQFLTNSAERMRVTSGGAVGINTSAPGAQLETYVSAGSTVAFRLNTNYVGGNAVDINPYISGVSNAGYSVTVGGTIRQVIDSSGNTGIGTTSPSHRLHVNGNAYVPITNSYYCYTADYGMGTPASSGLQIFTGTSDTIRFGHMASGTFSERMRMDSTGRLLIGTTTADQLLTVAGNIATTNGANRFIKLCSSTNYNYTVSAVGDDFQILEAGTTARLTIKYPNGDVGIGTTSPASRLHAAGITRISDATNSTAVAIDPVTTAGLTSIIAQFGGSQLAFGAAGVENFRITSTGGITSSNLADAVGYKGLPQNSQTAAYTLALSDMGKHISITTGGVVIPANGSVAFPIGSAVTIFNNSGSNQTISITTDTLRQAGTANTGSRTLAQYGVATVLKVTSTVWVISGAGVS
jgi:hypothetical protein